MDQPVDDPFNPTLQPKPSSFLDYPGVRSAILQASLQMLQPTSVGQSPIGAIANSVGAGGEAYRRSIGTNVAQRKQKADEVNTESLVNYRDDSRQPGGKAGAQITLSQRMKMQRDDQKDFNKWLDAQAKELVTQDVSGVLTPAAARQQLLDKKDETIKNYQTQKAVSKEATSSKVMRTSQDLMDARPDLFAQLKSGLAAGDEDAIQALATLKERVADPESLDALLGGLGG